MSRKRLGPFRKPVGNTRAPRGTLTVRDQRVIDQQKLNRAPPEVKFKNS